MSSNEELYQIADELRAIASQGIHFAESAYDVERYERILATSARLVAVLERRSPDEVLARFRDSLSHMSPLVGAEAVVFRDGELLLIRRHDDGLWAVPGGLTEVGETLAETAIRELEEEAGISGHVTELLGIFDSRLWHSQTKAQLYHFLFLAEAGDATPTPGPEALDVDFFSEDSLPALSPGHHLRVPFVFKLLRGEIPTPYFDPAKGR